MTIGSPDTLPIATQSAPAALFGRAFLLGLVTLLSLGVYGPWAQVRLRRYYWSTVLPGGQPMEYAQTGLNTAARWLVWLAALCLWVLICGIGLTALSLLVCGTPVPGYALIAVGLIPLGFAARDHGRSDARAQTRWRAIRFGMDRGHWAYARLATARLAMTIASLGFLWPKMTFDLEAHRTRRTTFGTVRLAQGGDWQMLQPAFARAYLPGFGCAVALAIALFEDPRAAYALIVLGPLLLAGGLYYHVAATNLLDARKSAGGLGMTSARSAGATARIIGIGGLRLAVAIAVPAVLVLAAPAQIGDLPALADLAAARPAALGLAAGLLLGGGIVGALWLALWHSAVALPLWRTRADALGLKGISALSGIGPGEAAP